MIGRHQERIYFPNKSGAPLLADIESAPRFDGSLMTGPGRRISQRSGVVHQINAQLYNATDLDLFARLARTSAFETYGTGSCSCSIVLRLSLSYEQQSCQSAPLALGSPLLWRPIQDHRTTVPTCLI